MANLLNNMRTLQVEHNIPMRMDFSTKDLLTYYKSWTADFTEPEIERLLFLVIQDLEAKIQKEEQDF